MKKWLIVVPISSQLPLSLTKKKKLRVIISVVEITNKKRLKGGNPNTPLTTPNTPLKRRNGIVIFKTINAPIKKGLKIVVKRYTEEREKELIDAMFPVPKKERLMKKRKKEAIRRSLEVKCRYDGVDGVFDD
jgi:hypothetical protein